MSVCVCGHDREDHHRDAGMCQSVVGADWCPCAAFVEESDA